MSMSLNYGPTVSRTLQPGERSFDTLVWQQGKPPLDAELNLLFDIITDKFQKFVNTQLQSGFVNFNSFNFNTTWSNKFQLPETIANVNGWQLNINANGDSYIYLTPATIGSSHHRYDFVFLEVFKTLLTGNTVAHKPSAATIYKEGNVQDSINTISDDIIDPVIMLETSRRVQIQYRIRIKENVLVPNNQNSNVFDSSTYAQGGASIPITPYVFANQGSSGDYGLWRAGNGDNASRTQLQTIDGYVYAIPVALVFRRANAVYNDESLDGQQASAISIPGTSDRPDGLYNDSVVQSDVIDLRHQIVTKADYNTLLDEAINDLLTGNNTTKRQKSIQYDCMSDTAITGYSTIGTCDQTRSKWSDLQSTVTSYTAKINIGDTDTLKDFYTSRASGTWQIGDTITVKVPNGSPAGAIILGTNDSNPTTKPYIFSNAAGLIDVPGSWAGTETNTAIFTFSANLLVEEIWIVYDIQYPKNQGSTYISDSILNIQYKNASAYPNAIASYAPHTGVVRTGSNLFSTALYNSRNSKQLNYQHVGSFNNYASNYSTNSKNKQVQVTPIIASTASMSSSSLVMLVKNYKLADKRIYLPFQTNKTWFIRGVYTAATGGSEVATESFVNEHPSLISGQVFKHPSLSYSFANIVSMIYDPAGTHVELLAASGGQYYPVFRQNIIGDIDQFILVDSNNNIYTPPVSTLSSFNITHKSILTAKVNAYTINSENPVDNWIQVRNDAGLVDGQQVWIDIDYIGEPHNGAEIKIIYQYLPYQGLVDNIGTVLSAKLKAIRGFMHSDGTGNVASNIDLTKFMRPLTSYMPMPVDKEFNLDGDSISGAGQIGKYNGVDLCYVNSEVLDYSVIGEQPVLINDIVTAAFNSGLIAVERGGNDATTDKAKMLPSASIANYKQAIIFGLGLARNNITLQDEVVLYVWTLTNNVTDNKFVASDTTNIGVDFFFINKRPLIKQE